MTSLAPRAWRTTNSKRPMADDQNDQLPMTSNQRPTIKSPRGTRDLLPPETALWNFVEAAVRDVFRAYNFHEIRTPIFESTELFAQGVAEETDIVTKEMFTWQDRDPPETDNAH